ncbi:MAG: ATP-binding cassette domain-containing protein [Parasporobacterium sp.]|nr:ATP-binding cassette domain-containing protein [Parasporobacterium sp.]
MIDIDIVKKLGDFTLNMKFKSDDEVVALLGASGCGKSMTLKCIAGIEKPDKGHIIVDGVTLFDSEKGINLTPQKRHTGLMFQNYALFPNMSVRQNIEAGARREKDRSLRRLKVDQVIKSFGLEKVEKLYPSQISGGQQQRAALARILVSDPVILLLDEPFSALDSHLRFRMEQEVGKVMRDFGKTVIMVSHDRDEVFQLCDKIAVINDGAVDVYGTQKEIFTNPVTRNAAVLTGCRNISAVEIFAENNSDAPLDEENLTEANAEISSENYFTESSVENSVADGGQVTLRAADWNINLTVGHVPADTKYIGIRAHDLRFVADEDEPRANVISCNVISEIESPFTYHITLQSADSPEASTFEWNIEKEIWQEIRAEQVKLYFPPEAVIFLKK